MTLPISAASLLRLPLWSLLASLTLAGAENKSDGRREPATAGSATLEAQPEEVNVAASSRGASATGPGGNNLLALIDESNGTAASLTPNPATGRSVTTIKLADSTDVTRIALQVGAQKGKLLVYALNADEPAAGQQDPARAGKLISEFVLDGTNPTVSADLGKMSVKAVAIVWVPDTPGQPLTVANVGVFTKNPPPAAATAANAASTAAGAEADKKAPAPAAKPSSNSEGTSRPIPPQTRALSEP